MTLKTMKKGMIVCLSLAWMNVSCGDKSTTEPEEANIKDLGWTDNNATLAPGRSIGIDGEVLANVNSQVDFTIADTANNEIKQDDKSLRVVSQNPPAGKNTFSLQDDMGVQVAAGSEACNGDYVLNVNVKAGRSNVVKPLYFKVVDGKECQPATALPSKSGAVYNVLGPKEGAFDLVSGGPVHKNAPSTTKDLADRTSIGSSTAHGGFRKALASGNGARFVVDNSTPYEAVTPEVARKVVDSSALSRTTETLKAGDIVYVKLSDARENGAIYVLKITRADDTTAPSTRGTNGGVLEFDYKKATP